MCTTRRGVRESIPASRAVYYYSHIIIIIIAVFVRSAAPFVLAADDKRRRRGRGRKPSLPARGWYTDRSGAEGHARDDVITRAVLFMSRFVYPRLFPSKRFINHCSGARVATGRLGRDAGWTRTFRSFGYIRLRKFVSDTTGRIGGARSTKIYMQSIQLFRRERINKTWRKKRNKIIPPFDRNLQPYYIWRVTWVHVG